MSHVEKFVRSDLFDRICILTESRSIEIRKEALYALCNALTSADIQLMGEIYRKTESKLIKLLIEATNIIEPKLTFLVLGSIECVLKLD